MRMYAVVEEKRTKNRKYFREITQAVAYIDSCRRFDRNHPVESGGIPGRTYLSLKLVEKDSYPCKACGGECENTPSQYLVFPYCRGCYYSGKAMNDINSDVLGYFRSAFPDASVDVEHTGGGCFWLSFRWDNVDVFYAATDGEALLPDDWNSGWGFLGKGSWEQETSPEYEDEDSTLLYRAGITKEEIVEAIRKDRYGTLSDNA